MLTARHVPRNMHHVSRIKGLPGVDGWTIIEQNEGKKYASVP